MDNMILKIIINLRDLFEKYRLLNYYNNLLIEPHSYEYNLHLNQIKELKNNYNYNLEQSNLLMNKLKLQDIQFYSGKIEYFKDFYKRYYEVVIEVDNAIMLNIHLNKMNVLENDILRLTINKYINSTNYKLVLFIDELKSIESFINILQNTIR